MKALITKLFLFTLILIFSPLVANGNVSVATEQELRDAIANAGITPTTILIATNITVTGTFFTIPADANITLSTYQSQNVEIRRTETGARHFTVNGTLTLNAGVSITSDIALLTAGSRGGLQVNNEGTFIMNGGEIRSNRMAGNGGGVQVLAGGSFYMNGGRIIGNTGNGGAGVFTQGTFTMTDGTISENTTTNASTLGGGGVRVDGANGTFIMRGGAIVNNIADVATGCLGGSAIRVNNADSRVTIDGSVTISGEFSGVNSANFTMLTSSVLTIPAEETLTMRAATTFTNNGTIINNGTIVNRAGIEGTGIIQAQLTIADGGQGATTSGLRTENTPITLVEGTRTGHDFLGWAIVGHPTLSNETAFDMPYNALTATAEWEALMFEVTFNSQSGNAVVPQTIPYGSLVAPPAPPTRFAYLFGGWFRDAETTQPWNFATDVVRSDITLFARWNPHNHMLTINNLATGGDPTQTGNVQIGTVVALVEGTRVGHYFDRWYVVSGGVTLSNTNTFTMPSNDVTVRADWTPMNYAITFNSRGGSAVNDTNAYHGTLLIEPASPTLALHTFEGWYTDETFDMAWDFSTDVVVSEMTLYARWALYTYVITFNSRGGTAVDEITVEHGALATAPEPPTRRGYTFEGWYISENLDVAWNFDTDVVTSDLTLYARWDIATFVVTFNSRGGSPVSDTVVNYGTLLIAPPTPILENYEFLGWYVDEATTIAWNFATSVVVSDTTLFARWDTHFEMLTINNLATGGNPTPSGYVEVGTQVALVEGTRTGYEFMGWTVVSGNVVISGMNTFTMPPNPVMLTAHWQSTGTNLAEMQLTASLQVYPNPVMDQLHITIDELRIGDIVELFDMNGRRVFAQPIVNREFTIDMSSFPLGIYILRIGEQTMRIVKQ